MMNLKGKERDRQTDGPEEENEVDLIEEDEEDAATEMWPHQAVEKETESKKDEEITKKKRKKSKEVDRDTVSQIDYFQEIAESLKAFACMMVDIKVVKVEIKGMKEMLQELTGKKNKGREKVREGNAGDEQQKERDREKMDAGRIINELGFGDGDREERDDFGIDFGTNVDAGECENCSDEGDSEESDDDAVGFDDIFGVDNGKDADDISFSAEEKGAMSIDEDFGRLDEVRGEENQTHEKSIESEKNEEGVGQERLEKDVEKSSPRETMAWEKLSDEVISHLHERATSKGNFARNLLRKLVDDDILVNCNCYGKSPSHSRRRNVQAIDPDILKYVLKTTCDIYGVGESDRTKCNCECVEYINAFCRELYRKFLRNQSRIGTNDKEASEKKDAERTELLRNDNDPRDRGLDLKQNKDKERREESVFGNTDGDIRDGEVVRGEKEFPRDKLSEGEIRELHEKNRKRECFARSVVKKFISSDILMNSNCSGKSTANSCRPNVQAVDPQILQYALQITYDVYNVKEHEKKDCRRKCIEAINSHCRSLFFNLPKRQSAAKSRAKLLMSGEVLRDPGLEYRLITGMSRRSENVEDGGEEDGKGVNQEKRLPWQRLSDKEIQDIRISGQCKTRGSFATHILKKLVPDDVLVNSNCYGKYTHDSRRPNVQPIDPDILRYVLKTTFEVYGVEESDRNKCQRECTQSIDSHCRYLLKKLCSSISMKKATDEDVNKSEPKEGGLRHKTVGERVRNENSKDSGRVNIEEGVHWESSSEEDIISIHTRAKSKGDFAKNVLRKLVGDDTLINSSSSYETVKSHGLQLINRDIMSHVIRSTCDVYGVSEAEKKGCHSECIDAIESYCKYLREGR